MLYTNFNTISNLRPHVRVLLCTYLAVVYYLTLSVVRSCWNKFGFADRSSNSTLIIKTITAGGIVDSRIGSATEH